MSDNEDDYNFESDEDDCDCFECVARRDGEDDYYSTPASAVPRLCAQLRANDPSALPEGPNVAFEPNVPDSCRLMIAEALLQNTVVRRIRLELDDYRKSSTDAMAKYLAQSKHLLAVELTLDVNCRMEYTHQQSLSTFIKAIGQSTSVQELSLTNLGLESASKSFEYLLTRTKSLRRLRVDLKGRGPFQEVATAAIASGFSKNTTLREIELYAWQQTGLIPVLTALKDHPVLEKLHLVGYLSLAGMDSLLRGNNSQLKELVIGRFKGSIGEQMVGFESFMREMERNTTILKMIIAAVPLSRDGSQQLNAVLRRNTVLQELDLSGNSLGSAGLAEIAPALYRNTFIRGLELSRNGLDDIAAANILRELLRRNKTITRLSIAHNAFGSNVAAVRCIADGFRVNTTLKTLGLFSCELDDQGLSILAESLGQQKRGLVNLVLSENQITCSGLRALVNNATASLSTIHNLDLSKNSLFDEGATCLAETLTQKMLPSLKCLRLINCRISDDGLVALMSALEENETLENLDLEGNTFSVQGYLALASSLPNIKGLRQIDISCTTPDPTVMSAMLEGVRKNTSLHYVIIRGFEKGKWSEELSFLLYRNKFRRLLQVSDTDDRESLGLWSRALGSVATRPDVLFHVLTSKAGLIRATPREDSKKRKREDREQVVTYSITTNFPLH
jgi:Ran GTPase-activating protein (RanGAP) involved in mRNA processing and transport